MDELKLLIDMVKDVPEYVIWILAGYLFFKLFVIGSIYKIIALAVTKGHDVLVKHKELPPPPPVNSFHKIDRLTIYGQADCVVNQLERLVGMTTKINSSYIHESDVFWLRDAITEKMNKDKETTNSTTS